MSECERGREPLARRPSKVVGSHQSMTMHGPVTCEEYEPEGVATAQKVRDLLEVFDVLPREAAEAIGVPAIEVYRMQQGEYVFENEDAALSFIHDRLLKRVST